MSAIRPNVEQFKMLAEAASSDSGKVVMLNLLKLRSGDGVGECDTYGDAAVKMVQSTGGRLLYLGRCDQVLIGDAFNDWDAIALVEYPSRHAFLDMVARPDYLQAHEHREAGLERTIVLATTPRPIP